MINRIRTDADMMSTMFPYDMRMYCVYEWEGGDDGDLLGEDTGGKVETLMGAVKCSVQTSTTALGEVLDNEYIILSPCLDMSAINTLPDGAPEGTTPYYRLEVDMNGRTNKATGTDIFSVDNLEVYRLDDVPIGCKIIVHLSSGTWQW